MDANRSVVRFDPQSDDSRALTPFDPIGHFFSPDGERYYLATQDFNIRVWDFKHGGRPLLIFIGHEDQVEPPALSHDGKFMASGSDDRTLRLWDTQTGELLVTVKNAGQTFSPIFSFDDKYLAAVSTRASQTKVWEMQTLLSIPQVLKKNQTSSLSPDGKVLLTQEDAPAPTAFLRGNSAKLALRDWQTRQTLFVYRISGFYPCTGFDCTKFSPSGDLIAKARRLENYELDGITILNRNTGEIVTRFDGHRGASNAVSFSPNGETLVTGGWNDHLIKLWDTATWRERATMRGHLDAITSLDFSPDGGPVSQ